MIIYYSQPFVFSLIGSVRENPLIRHQGKTGGPRNEDSLTAGSGRGLWGLAGCLGSDPSTEAEVVADHLVVLGHV